MEKNGLSDMKSKATISKIMALSVMLLPLISACSSEYDLHGVDPKEYYAAHPIENKVETRHALLMVQFTGGTQNLSESEIRSLRDSLAKINPHATEAITLQVSTGMSHSGQHVQQIKNLLRKSGYNLPVNIAHKKINGAGKMIIDLTYAAVVLPDCPDWKKSPVTTYSNTLPANFGCASTVNLGLMIDNPRDLVHGQDSRKNNTERGAKAISDYRSGGAAASSSSGASSDATASVSSGR